MMSVCEKLPSKDFIKYETIHFRTLMMINFGALKALGNVQQQCSGMFSTLGSSIAEHTRPTAGALMMMCHRQMVGGNVPNRYYR